MNERPEPVQLEAGLSADYNPYKTMDLGRGRDCCFDMCKHFGHVECDFPYAKRKRWYMVDCYLLGGIVTLLIRAKNSREASKKAWKQAAYWNVLIMSMDVTHIPKNYVRKTHTHLQRKEYLSLDRGNPFFGRDEENTDG